MAKKMIALRPGSLMEVAATKGITSILSLQEKTRADRKTLQSINDGICVKESTLQKIATRLHIPLDHLAPPPEPRIPTAQKQAATNHARELVLKPLNAKQLFELLSEISLQDNLSWALKLDQASSEVLKQLLQFETAVREWLRLLNDREREEENQKSLKRQLGKIKTRGDIENLIQAIGAANIKIFGATYIRWDYEEILHGPYGERSDSAEYRSSIHAYISIEPRNMTSSRAEVDEGDKPPRFYGDDQLWGLDYILVDGEIVWSRPPQPKMILDDDGIPSWDEQS
jgi:hypothetical protein